MKRFTHILAAVILVLLSRIGYAQHQPHSILNVRLNDDASFKVFIDGKPYSKRVTRARIVDLTPTRHYLQVYRVANYAGYETLDNAFRGYIIIQPYSESFVTVVPEENRLQFDQVIAFGNPSWKPHHDKPDVCFYPKPGRNNNAACEVIQLQPIGPQPIDLASFGQLRHTISAATFENTKLTIFKQALLHYYFTAAQVRELMCLFTFESYKLDVAKLAYPRTLDPQNYFLINNEFTFSSSIDELNNYMAMR